MSNSPTNSTSPSESRRDFLRTSAVAGTAAATSLTTLVQPVHAQGSASLKIGIVGIGGRGSGAATQAINADPNVELVAAADIVEGKVQRSLSNIQNQLKQDGDEKAAARVNVSEENIKIAHFKTGREKIVFGCLYGFFVK